MNTKKRGRKTRSQLTLIRQELVLRHLPLARSLAKPMKAHWRNSREDFDSAAYLALVEAAESFDPTRQIRFSTFARHRIIGAMRDVQRGLLEQRGLTYEVARLRTLLASNKIPCRQSDGAVLGVEPEKPVGSDLELQETIEHWLAMLPAKHAAACRLLFLNGKSQTEAARILGYSQSRLSSMRREALSILQEAWHARRRGDAA